MERRQRRCIPDRRRQAVPCTCRCHWEVSPRLLAEPWRQEERCVRVGGNESPRCLSSAVSPVYSTRSNMHFDTTGTQHSFIHSTTMSPLYESPLRSLLETANRPDAAIAGSLSCRDERARNSNSKQEQEEECHTVHTPAYILA